MKCASAIPIRRGHSGFSLLEMMIAIAVMFILAALFAPKLMTQVYNIRIRYAATDLSGILQRTRMEAVRRNSFYSLQRNGGNPVTVQVVDRTGAVVPTIQTMVLSGGVDGSFGTGSGAPGEAALVASLGFTPAASGVGAPSFNARGLPCINTGAATCTLPGQGLVFFLSGTSGSNGAVGWSAVAVTPSGRCEVWAYNGANWTQM